MVRLKTLSGQGLFGLALILLAAVPAVAQTTGTLSGAVADQTGGVLPGASVVAVHVPTNTSYETTSDPQGNFAIPNVRVGGPYKVTASLSGFREQAQEGIFVKLGAEAPVTFKLEVQTVAESITVTADANPIINPGRTGAGSNLYRETMETLPSLSRNINDFARLSPYFQTDAGRGGLVVVGKNYRYNAIQIDGAVSNDLFGLSSTGQPGGQAGTNPMSLDAIDEVQLVVAPYDVRLGGFTGGGINAVTRSGSNAFHGTGYFFYRNNDLVGDGPLDRPLADFSNKQYGASIGGPILKDKLFFFVTGRADEAELAVRLLGQRQLGPGLRTPARDRSREEHPERPSTGSIPAGSTSSTTCATATRSSAASTTTSPRDTSSSSGTTTSRGATSSSAR